MICNKCNHKLPDDSEFCQYCGNKIVQGFVISPHVIEELTVKKVKAPADFTLNNVTMRTRTASKKKKIVKTRYCSRCGSLIDNNVCIGCGKKYFKGIKLTKFSIMVMILSLILIISIILNIAQLIDRKEIKERRDYWMERTEELENKVNNLKIEVDDLESEILENWAKISFYDSSVVIVGDDGTDAYHKYGCSKLDTSNGYWIFNKEAADYKGYNRCSRCND